jgi:molecular chaperone GrpE
MNDDLTQKKDDVVVDIEGAEETVLEENSLHEKVASLKEKLAQVQGERDEYLLGWQRAKADVVNARRDMDARLMDSLKYAKEDVIADLIPVIDSFDLAMRNKAAWETAPKEWRMGVEYIYNQLMSVLAGHGVTVENPVGAAFDVTKHNALEMVSSPEGKVGMVAEVVQKGFTIGTKVIRPASVKVFE